MKLYLILLTLFACASATRCALRPIKITPAFCARPPVVPVSLPGYIGTWYQIFVNEGAAVFSDNFCVTAQYKLKGRGLDVLNCAANVGVKQASCARASAFPRAGAGSPSRLSVQFGPSAPVNDYNIVALLGDKEYGYHAAAVYSCAVVKGKPFTIWFILARNPYRPYQKLWELMHVLRCKGYDVYNERFTKTQHGKGCKYFFMPSGFFDKSQTSGLTPGAPSNGLVTSGGPPPGVLPTA